MKPDKAQQQTLSVRIDDALRRRLERARQLSASKTGEPVSTSEIAKQFLESARDDRLEVVDLLAEPTDSLRHIRRKGEAGMVLSRAEWTAIAHFVRHGLEASPDQTPNPVSRESLDRGPGCLRRRLRPARRRRLEAGRLLPWQPSA